MDEAVRDDLLRLRTALSAASARLEAILTDASQVSEEVITIRSALASLLAHMARRDRDDLMRFIRAIHNEEEAWLVLHVQRAAVDCVYHGKLSREQRAVLGR